MPGGFHITGAGEYGDCPEDCPSDTNQGDLNFLHYLKNALWYIDPSGHFVFYELFFSLKALTRKIFKLNFLFFFVFLKVVQPKLFSLTYSGAPGYLKLYQRLF